MRACVERHFHALTDPCGNKLAHVAQIERACGPDVHKLCAHITRAAEVLACIRPKLDEVSKPCEDSLAKVVSPLAFVLH
jgi:hypothetical protein